MGRKPKSPDKIRTCIDVDRQLWAWVKFEAALKGKTTSEIVENLIKEYYQHKKAKFPKEIPAF